MKYGIWYDYCFDEHDSDFYNVGYVDNLADIDNLLTENFKPPTAEFKKWDKDKVESLQVGEYTHFTYKGWTHGVYITAIQNENDDEHFMSDFEEK